MSVCGLCRLNPAFNDCVEDDVKREFGVISSGCTGVTDLILTLLAGRTVSVAWVLEFQ